MFKPFDQIKIGDSAKLVKEITLADIKKFVEMTGDDNPLHVDRTYAETTPFKDIVVHGMLGASFISTLIGTQLPGKGALWISQTLNFLLPVRLEDILTISCVVTRIQERDRILDLETTITNQFKQQVLSGEGKVKVLETRDPAPLKTGDGAEERKVAIVTGGSGGIGKEISRCLAELGWAVVVNYRSQSSRADAVVEAIQAAGGKAIAVKGDIADLDDCNALIQTALSTFGGLRLLVNNASPKLSTKPFSSLDWADLEHHLEVQLHGAFNLCQACIPVMKERGYGKIVNITSEVLDGAPPAQWTSYNVAKASLQALSKSLAVEVGPVGIRVNCVSPGMVDAGLAGDIPEKARLIVERQTPLRRLAQPKDVAAAVAYLASGAGDHITGETIRVNGGHVML